MELRANEKAIRNLMQNYDKYKEIIDLAPEDLINIYSRNSFNEIHSKNIGNPTLLNIVLKEEAEENIREAKLIVNAVESTASLIPRNVWVLIKGKYGENISLADEEYNDISIDAFEHYKGFFNVAIKRKIGEGIFNKFS